MWAFPRTVALTTRVLDLEPQSPAAQHIAEPMNVGTVMLMLFSTLLVGVLIVVVDTLIDRRCCCPDEESIVEQPALVRPLLQRQLLPTSAAAVDEYPLMPILLTVDGLTQQSAAPPMAVLYSEAMPVSYDDACARLVLESTSCESLTCDCSLDLHHN